MYACTSQSPYLHVYSLVFVTLFAAGALGRARKPGDTTRLHRQLYFDSGGQRCCCVLDRSLRYVQAVVLSPLVDWLNRFASP